MKKKVKKKVVKKAKKQVKGSESNVPENLNLILDELELGKSGMIVEIQGTKPLLMNRFSPFQHKAILDKTMGLTVSKRKKNPERDALEGVYWIGKEAKTINAAKNCRYGMPAGGIKKGIVRAVKLVKDGAMTDARGSFHIVNVEDKVNNNIEIRCPEGPIIREDMIRVSNGNPDIRHRCQFNNWSATLTIEYNTKLISPKRILGWIKACGEYVGIGDWRMFTEKSSGFFGAFKVASATAYEPKE